MRRIHPLASVLLCVSLSVVLACGSSSADDDDDDNQADAGDGTPDADIAGMDWQPLITGDWSLPPGGENTGDNHSVVLDRDVYVGAIRPIEPVGTHHTLLSYSGAAGVIYASGVGTNAVVFPEGVGLKLPAGSNVNLQLHIYNVSDNTLEGTSGIEIVEVAAGDVVHEADLFLPGPLGFSLPKGQETSFTSTCTVRTPYTIFALFPHMHQLGTHFKTTVTTGGQDTTLHDAPYDFNEQAFDIFEPIALSPGDTIKTTCTWFNTFESAVGWGESSNSEMCFSILYRYPAGTDEFCGL